MYYEINVARRIGKMPFNSNEDRYEHLFATASRSLQTMYAVERVLPAIVAAFPEPNHHVTLHRHETIGTEIPLSAVFDSIEKHGEPK